MRGIDYQQAQLYVQQSMEYALQHNMPPMAIVVLDSGGHIKAAGCQDGTGILRYEIAHSKAHAALGMAMDTSVISQLHKKGVLADHFLNSISAASNGKFNANPGGVLIMHKQHIIGAIGLSGAAAEQDDYIARQVLKSSSYT